METIKQRSELYRLIKSIIKIKMEEGAYPTTFTYCEGRGKPLFTFTVDRKQEDHFIDENGQKWVKA